MSHIYRPAILLKTGNGHITLPTGLFIGLAYDCYLFNAPTILGTASPGSIYSNSRERSELIVLLSVVTSILNTLPQFELFRIRYARHSKRQTSSRLPTSRSKPDSHPRLNPFGKVRLSVCEGIRDRDKTKKMRAIDHRLNIALPRDIYGSIMRQLTLCY